MYIVKNRCNKIYLKTYSYLNAIRFLVENFSNNNTVRIYKNRKCLK